MQPSAPAASLLAPQCSAWGLGTRAVVFKAMFQLLKATINLQGYYSNLKSKPNREANLVAVPPGWQIEWSQAALTILGGTQSKVSH